MADALRLLTGTTASGKEAVAMALAERSEGEIVSVDSMKVYREMDIGTAKPSRQDRQRVRHYMIDVVEPSVSYSLASYLGDALQAKASVEVGGRMPIFSGGTPLYVRALVYGVFEGPPADWALRRDLSEKAEREGVAALHSELAKVDPVAAGRIHPNDRKRLVRALEVVRLTGRRISSLQEQGPEAGPQRPARVVALRRHPEDLRERIVARVDRMLRQGLVEEVRSVAPRLGRTARSGIGYREILEMLEGRLSLDEAREKIVARTWRMSRKQMTWFRSLPGLLWVDAGPQDKVESLADRVQSLWEGAWN